MVKKILYYFLILFLFQIKLAFSQTSKTNDFIVDFGETFEKVGLSKEQITKIKDLVIARELFLAEDAKLQNELIAKSFFVFDGKEATIKYSNQQFIKSLSEIITQAQFKQLFQPQLEYKIKRIANDKETLLEKRYKFTPDQKSKLKKLLHETTTDEIITKEYYNYDDNLSWNNYTTEKIKSSKKESELIKSFGLFYSRDTKTDALIKKLKDGNIDADRINQILLALQVLQEQNDKRLMTWRENDAANSFNFHDPGDDEYAIYLVFREKLSSILKIAEFRTIFASQMQNRINKDSEKEFQTIKIAYQLTNPQYEEIQKLILEKNTEKIVTEEYYKYNYELYQQKLRAVEYRHEKNIRETIQIMATKNETKITK